MVNYFVSYVYSNNRETGYGNATITLDHFVSCLEDIKSIEDEIKANDPYVKKCCILNYQII